ncbi:response regulator transcription factor [Streptomyces sp. CB04723]|uniref:response regulator transcription factor n=1 Tax=Streptomyces TaxID=1883 RepID=UPI0015C410D1|nr:response regulator transcription factor [Streptomyces sp. CB04723]QLG31256.1 response regulator transcription factor [Streptomyces sp. CB04723]
MTAPTHTDQLRSATANGRGPTLGPRPEPTTVCVQAADPLSHAGAVAQLRARPEIRLLDGPEPDAQILLLVAETVDDDVRVQARRTQRTSGTRTVLVATAIDRHQVVSAAECGIGGIVRRADATPDHLVTVITSVAAGQAHLPGDLLAQLLTDVGRIAPPGLSALRLSSRERDVLRMVAEGQDTPHIAETLGFAVRTIKGDLHRVMIRYQLPNRAAAVAYALREGLI